MQIRWMIRRDMPEVLAIETLCFDLPWVEDDFVRCLRQRNCIGMVCEEDQKVKGFMIYELYKERLALLNLGVPPAFRRMGIGTSMIDKLKGKLSDQRRNKIILSVSEDNLDGQLFFANQGFIAVSVDRNFYENGRDAYNFVYDTSGQSVPDLLRAFTQRNSLLVPGQ